MKSQSSACTSVGRCGTPCAPSINTNAPTACARSITSSTGMIVPSTLDIDAMPTIFVCFVNSVSSAEVSR